MRRLRFWAVVVAAAAFVASPLVLQAQPRPGAAGGGEQGYQAPFELPRLPAGCLGRTTFSSSFAVYGPALFPQVGPIAATHLRNSRPDFYRLPMDVARGPTPLDLLPLAPTAGADGAHTHVRETRASLIEAFPPPYGTAVSASQLFERDAAASYRTGLVHDGAVPVESGAVRGRAVSVLLHAYSRSDLTWSQFRGELAQPANFFPRDAVVRYVAPVYGIHHLDVSHAGPQDYLLRWYPRAHLVADVDIDRLAYHANSDATAGPVRRGVYVPASGSTAAVPPVRSADRPGLDAPLRYVAPCAYELVWSRYDIDAAATDSRFLPGGRISSVAFVTSVVRNLWLRHRFGVRLAEWRDRYGDGLESFHDWFPRVREEIVAASAGVELAAWQAFVARVAAAHPTLTQAQRGALAAARAERAAECAPLTDAVARGNAASWCAAFASPYVRVPAFQVSALTDFTRLPAAAAGADRAPLRQVMARAVPAGGLANYHLCIRPLLTFHYRNGAYAASELSRSAVRTAGMAHYYRPVSELFGFGGRCQRLYVNLAAAAGERSAASYGYLAGDVASGTTMFRFAPWTYVGDRWGVFYGYRADGTATSDRSRSVLYAGDPAELPRVWPHYYTVSTSAGVGRDLQYVPHDQASNPRIRPLGDRSLLFGLHVDHDSYFTVAWADVTWHHVMPLGHTLFRYYASLEASYAVPGRPASAQSGPVPSGDRVGHYGESPALSAHASILRVFPWASILAGDPSAELLQGVRGYGLAGEHRDVSLASVGDAKYCHLIHCHGYAALGYAPSAYALLPWPRVPPRWVSRSCPVGGFSRLALAARCAGG